LFHPVVIISNAIYQYQHFKSTEDAKSDHDMKSDT